MIKRIICSLLTVTFSAGWINVLADNGMGKKLDDAVSKWNAQYRGTDYVINDIDDETRQYIESLPQDVEIEIYKRQIPDITKSVFSGTDKVQLSDETLPWYKAGTVEEKKQAFIERIKMSHGVAFNDGTYKPAYLDTFNTVLGNVLMGDEENIKKASQILVESLGDDESLSYHSDMKAWSFTDLQPYILWYEYRHLLTQEAQDALYRYIVRMGRKDRDFSPYKTSLELHRNCYHNQGSDGLVAGLFYAQIADDKRMLKRMEDYIDRCIAHLAMDGAAGDSTAPGYGGFTYTNFATCYRYAEDERIKAKLEIILDWFTAQIVNQAHYESNSLAGSWRRAYGCQYTTNTEKQDYRTILHLVTDGNSFFSPEGNSGGYAWWFSNAATLDLYFPKWCENFLKNRQYPYNVWQLMSLNDEPELLGQQFGNFTVSKNYFSEKKTYMTEEYTIGGSPATWYVVGMSEQDAVFRATWRRNENVEDIKDASDIGLMWPLYAYDYDIAVSGDNATKCYDSWTFPCGWGKEFAMTDKNKAIVLSWPGRVGDFGTSTATNYYALPIETWKNMGASMILTHYDEMKGIWFGDRFIEGQVQLFTTGDEEVRVKLIGEGVPARLKGDETIYIEDFNTYISLEPLNTTSLGRDCDVSFLDFGNELGKGNYLGRNGVSVSTNMEVNNTLLITAYNYYGEETSFTLEEREKQRNGFIVEMADKKDYKTIGEFKAHIDTTSFESYDTDDIWTVKYKSGDSNMELNVDTRLMTMEDSYINDEAVLREEYDNNDIPMAYATRVTDPETGVTYGSWNKMEYFDYLESDIFKDKEVIRTETMVQSTKKEITLGDIKVENPANCACMIMHEPVDNEYIFLNFTDKTAKFKITTPEGIVNIENMNYGKVIYRPGEEKELETMFVPRMTLLDTKVTITGKD